MAAAKPFMLFPLLCAAVLFPVSASAVTQSVYTNYSWMDGFTYDHVSWVNLGSKTIGTGPGYPTTFSWSHILPPELTDPACKVTKAFLWIDANSVDYNNNHLDINGVFDVLDHKFFDNTTVDLCSTAGDFWGKGSVDVKVTAGEYKLKLNSAVLLIDYENYGQSPIPDPSTFILLSTGIGLFAVHRFRRKS